MTISATTFETSRYHISVVPTMIDLHERNEDGEMLVGESFAVQISNAYGRRWESVKTWNTTLVRDDDGYGHVAGFEKAQSEAVAYASLLADFISQDKRLNERNWAEINPVYGSQCYVDNDGEAELIAWERAQD